MKTLIVVDMQNDFITGPLGTPEAQAIVPNVKKKIEEYKARGDKIIYTMDTHDEHYLSTNEGKHLPVEHCIKGTHGWETADDLDLENCFYLNKFTFGWPRWDMVISYDSDAEIEIVGVCSDICVVSNALILKSQFPMFNITVDASCCAGTSPESHKAALQVMKMCQIDVVGE